MVNLSRHLKLPRTPTLIVSKRSMTYFSRLIAIKLLSRSLSLQLIKFLLFRMLSKNPTKLFLSQKVEKNKWVSVLTTKQKTLLIILGRNQVKTSRSTFLMAVQLNNNNPTCKLTLDIIHLSECLIDYLIVIKLLV